MANRYIRKRVNGWVIVNRTGRVLSRHSSKAKAQASFRAMEWSKHRKPGARRRSSR